MIFRDLWMLLSYLESGTSDTHADLSPEKQHHQGNYRRRNHTPNWHLLWRLPPQKLPLIADCHKNMGINLPELSCNNSLLSCQTVIQREYGLINVLHTCLVKLAVIEIKLFNLSSLQIYSDDCCPLNGTLFFHEVFFSHDIEISFLPMFDSASCLLL